MDAVQFSTLEILPLFLFIVVIVTAVAERINVPYPLLLVLAGLIVGFTPGVPVWNPPEDIVLALFLPPILFAAARTVSWQDIKTHLLTIGSLSVVLVVLTTLVIAIVLDAFVPKMTFISALVLGAIISPTDTVAAIAILSRMKVQQHIIRTIEIESLFNDATGIVLYNAGVLAIATGQLHPLQITTNTFLVGVGGIVVGFSLSYLAGWIITRFIAKSENELPIILSLVLAYVAYLLADRLGVSGVLAVVAAGLYHKRSERLVQPKTRLAEKSVWDTLIFFLNGLIFLTIGTQFPIYLNKVRYIPTHDLVTIAIITIVVLLALRFVWIALIEILMGWINRLRHIKNSSILPLRKIVLMSWSGMRGLVPLALAIALPVTLNDRLPFSNRNIVIFITIITILFTLLAQGLTLPSLIRFLGLGKDDVADLRETTKTYEALTKGSMKNMDVIIGPDQRYSAAAKQLVENYYANRLLQFTLSYESIVNSDKIWQEAEGLLNKILDHEREVLATMWQRNIISQEIYIRILHKLDRDEVGFASYGK